MLTRQGNFIKVLEKADKNKPAARLVLSAFFRCLRVRPVSRAGFRITDV